MARGISLHIGVDSVDPKHYGHSHPLPYCVQDALAMEEIARSIGFETNTLLDEQATSSSLKYFLEQAAMTLTGADILFISFSGHGSLMKDFNGDEKEGSNDETWLLYDRQFVDDELHLQWTAFQPGTRIIVISDSCHSGTVTKNLLTDTKKSLLEESERVYLLNKQVYNSRLKNIPARLKTPILCSVILIAACTDEQTTPARSDRGNPKSFFTDKLLEAWNNGRFSGNYRLFHELIKQKIKRSRPVPQYSFIGQAHFYFENQKPFTI